MSRLVLAVCPTNQDRNGLLGGSNEQLHIAPLADAVMAAASCYPSITACLFAAQPESQDRPRGSLEGLYAQQQAAHDWIASLKREGDLTVSLNLHSDSGTYSHCGYYYDSAGGPVSEWLGRALAERIKPYFSGRVLSADYSGYVFARLLRDVACPVLLEVGAHTIPSDVAAVRDHAPEIAGELVAVLVGFFGLDSIPPIDTGELRVFPEWALQRLANGQDSRDAIAFRDHLVALGLEVDPWRYGMPV